ncbi:hypothetical protein [Streptomyces jumonjinensis]|uniref:hypothetical protein n=1 Tax=Streptomyces jumonjinensis TaxID=1945 RepID=UPI003798CF62
MNAMHQYMLDSYRTMQRGERVPPLPGSGDARVLRELSGRIRAAARALARRP